MKPKTMTLGILTFCTQIIAQIAQVGEKCPLNDTTKSGTCKQISQCSIIHEQAKQGMDLNLCGVLDDLITAVVCCEDDPDSEVVLRSEMVGKLSEEMCEEYTKPVTTSVNAISLAINATPVTYKRPKCDHNSVPLIVNGQPAEAGEFPFMAIIGYNNNADWRCGGTLISTRFVLSAAHCTIHDKPTIVRLGELDLKSENDGSKHKDYLISEIIVHPDYSDSYKYHDIALLKTEKNVELTSFIRPACLNVKRNIENGKAIATGWGQTALVGEINNLLLKVVLNIYTNQDCEIYYSEKKELPKGIDSTMLCAGDLNTTKNTCFGDSGGPLLITKKGNKCEFYLIGVTSFGGACEVGTFPAVYTRVSEYISWIENIVW